MNLLRHILPTRTSTIIAAALTVAGLTAAIATPALASANTSPGSQPAQHSPARHQQGSDMSRVADGVTWTLSVSTSGTGQPCVSVSAVEGSESGSIGGSCGATDGPFTRLGEGTLSINGNLYNVAYGLVAPGIARVLVDISGGSTLTADVANHAWFVVTPLPSAGDPSADFTTVDARNGIGTLVGRGKLPALSAYALDREHAPIEH